MLSVPYELPVSSAGLWAALGAGRAPGAQQTFVGLNYLFMESPKENSHGLGLQPERTRLFLTAMS